MNLDDILEIRFNKDIPIPVFAVDRGLVRFPEVITPQIYRQLLYLSFIDMSGKTWQGLFLINTVEPDQAGVSGVKGMSEKLFILFCQGFNEQVISAIDPPVQFQKPYHVLTATPPVVVQNEDGTTHVETKSLENYVIRNTGVFAFTFDIDTDQRQVVNFIKQVMGYLEKLRTEDLLVQMGKWVGKNLPQAKYSRYRKTKVDIQPEDHLKPYGGFTPLYEFAGIALPEDAEGTYIDIEGEPYEWYKPQGIPHIKVRKEIDRMSAIMDVGRPMGNTVAFTYDVYRVPQMGIGEKTFAYKSHPNPN